MKQNAYARTSVMWFKNLHESICESYFSRGFVNQVWPAEMELEAKDWIHDQSNNIVIKNK